MNEIIIKRASYPHLLSHPFALFGGSCEYPSGGWSDYEMSYITLDEATEAGKKLIKPYSTWAHVVDLRTMKIVAEGLHFYPDGQNGWSLVA